MLVDILLPIRIKNAYTYLVPEHIISECGIGKRAIVQFGNKRMYSGLIVNIHIHHNSNVEKFKPILSIIDEYPIVNDKQLALWKWIAEYYLCFQGEVMNAALPSSLKLSSETKICLHPEFDSDFSALTDKEFLIAEALDINKVLSISDVIKIIGTPKVFPLIKTLIEKKIAIAEEEIKNAYIPKLVTVVKLRDEYKDEKKLEDLFNELYKNKKQEKQLNLLMHYIHLTGQDGLMFNEIKRSLLLTSAEFSISQINSLEKKGIFEVYSKRISRFKEYISKQMPDSIVFSKEQEVAYEKIKKSFTSTSTVLLHGVTSSGKTEIYIKLINEYINQGKQVLYLLPEIALTTQIINRLRMYFGDKVGVYHSRFNSQERAEVWQKSNNDNLLGEEIHYDIILGARSSLFLPFNNLGLIIIDEEHDSSYKQNNPAPRYNARDAAIYLAKIHDAKTLLGTATPSLESYYNAKSGKYSLVELNSRYGNIEMPEIIVADLKKDTRLKRMKSHFSDILYENIKTALENKKQVILFKNRRGFSLRLECDKCGWMPCCNHCDVTLTYHKFSNHLRCHYCGFTTKITEECPDCGNTAIIMKGYGTEQIEEELSLLFPNAKISRMDTDTMRSKNSFHQLITDFESKNIDILVGTQMITKGLDFENVTVVGVLGVDDMLSYPDYRAHERAYQLMVQVSGRSGRKNEQGKVILQTWNKNHKIINYVINNNYLAFYTDAIDERRKYSYPPYVRLIEITLRHRNEKFLDQASNKLSEVLKSKFANRILGPEYPLISKIKDEFQKIILVKLEKNLVTEKQKDVINKAIEDFQKLNEYKSIKVVIDVDI